MDRVDPVDDRIDISHDGESGYRLHCELWLPLPRRDVFSFFADARNLEVITPEWMQFSVVTAEPIVMRPGALIDYKLRVHGVPIRWQSEISSWEPPIQFIDEQRVGPYRYWHHEHRFEDRSDGTLVSDTVHYGVPGGNLVHRALVQPDLRKIFTHRTREIRRILLKQAA